MFKTIQIRVFLTIVLLFVSQISAKTIAQTQPIQGLPQQIPDRFPQPIPLPAPLPNTRPDLQPPQAPTPPLSPSTIQIPVRKIEIVGSTLLKPIDLQRITRPIEGRSVTLTELQGVADAITQLYLDRGYITSRAIVAKQDIVDGVVKIQTIEGSIEKIDIQGLERLQTGYVRDRLQQGIQIPFNQNALEDRLRLLKTDPLLETLEASLRPGTGIGQSILTVRLKEANSLTGFVGVDDYSSPSLGAERIGAVLSYRNVTGLGDEVSASYFRSFQGGSNAFDFNYRVPVNGMNGTVQVRYAPNRSKIVNSNVTVGEIRSDSDLYEISYRQPLIRSLREEFALSLSFAAQDGKTLLDNSGVPFAGISGADANGNIRTRVLKFGQDYLSRDLQGAWAARSQFNVGLKAFNATTNPDPAPSGQFFSWVGQVQRAQRLSADHLLIAQADLQLTPNSLLPSQQFTIGGGQILRGYSQNARSGDNGFRVSIEDRIALQKDSTGAPTLQLAPFIDFGSVWNKSNNPISTSQNFLSSVGLGAIYAPCPQCTLRIDYALPLVNFNQPGETAQNRSLSFSAGYSF